MDGEQSRRSSAREVDPDNRVWCSSRGRYVHVERCMDCRRLSGLHERDGMLYVLCGDGSDDRSARLTRDPAALRWR